jgi:hypothetical protein
MAYLPMLLMISALGCQPLCIQERDHLDIELVGRVRDGMRRPPLESGNASRIWSTVDGSKQAVRILDESGRGILLVTGVTLWHY